jgi:hypothetical protein
MISVSFSIFIYLYDLLLFINLSEIIKINTERFIK